MLALLYKFLIGRFGCEHKWQEYSNGIAEDTPRSFVEVDRRHRYPYVLVRCEKCGHHKRINLK